MLTTCLDVLLGTPALLVRCLFERLSACGLCLINDLFSFVSFVVVCIFYHFLLSVSVFREWSGLKYFDTVFV